MISPIGEKPCASRKALSLKLMNIWLVRVFGPAVAKTSVPFLFDTRTGSSFRLEFRHLAFAAGSLSPNCTMKLGTTRKKRASS